MSSFIPEAQLAAPPQGISQIKAAHGLTISVQREQVASVVDGKLRAVESSSGRDEPLAGRGERPVVLARKSITGTNSYVVAQLSPVPTEVHKGDARSQAEENVVVIGAVNRNKRPDSRRRVGLLLRLDLQPGFSVLLDQAVVQPGKRAGPIQFQDRAFELG